jgi:RNA polymerase sigma-70 factor (ECF subfamily)
MAIAMVGMMQGTRESGPAPQASAILAARKQDVPAPQRAGPLCSWYPVPPGAWVHTVITEAEYLIPPVRDEQQNNQALETFLAASEEQAFYVAYAALWDRETALEVVQESMARLVEYYRDKPPEEWPALFRTVLKSRISDIRRRRLIEQGRHRLVSLTGLFRSQHDEPVDTMEYEIPDNPRDDGVTAPEVQYVAAEIRSRVADALQSLSELQRQVFILREWRGMSIKETAVTLDCSENSVKQHHFRAMRALREQLAEVWEHAQPTAS